MSYIPRQVLVQTAFGELKVESKTPQVQIRPGERYVLTAQVASGAASLVSASYTWIERI